MPMENFLELTVYGVSLKYVVSSFSSKFVARDKPGGNRKLSKVKFKPNFGRNRLSYVAGKT